MPFVLELETFEEKSKYLKGLFEETYIKDIIDRNRIKNREEVLEVLLDFVYGQWDHLQIPLSYS